LYFDLLNQLGRLRSEYEEDFLETVLARAKRPGQESPPAIDLTVPLGGSTSASLLLTNTRSGPALVRCTVTEVRRADGVGPAFPPDLSVAPDDLRIPPHGEALLTLSLRADEGDYDLGELYVGSVRIDRDGEHPLEIPLRINAVSPARVGATVRSRRSPRSKTSMRKKTKRKS
jgi:hypothetical protein